MAQFVLALAQVELLAEVDPKAVLVALEITLVEPEVALLNWRLALILWRNEVPRMSKDNVRWKVHSELAGFNPVKFKLRKSVRLPSD